MNTKLKQFLMIQNIRIKEGSHCHTNIYDRIIQQDQFINKGIEEWNKGKLVVFLIPARTGTKRFHKLLELGAEFRFIKGRLKFGNQGNYAPFDSMVVILKQEARHSSQP